MSLGAPHDHDCTCPRCQSRRAKPREMTLAAIRKRFDCGSWDSADCLWLYTKAEHATEMYEASDRLLGVLADFFMASAQHAISAESDHLIAIRNAANFLAGKLRKAKGQ